MEYKERNNVEKTFMSLVERLKEESFCEMIKENPEKAETAMFEFCFENVSDIEKIYKFVKDKGCVFPEGTKAIKKDNAYEAAALIKILGSEESLIFVNKRDFLKVLRSAKETKLLKYLEEGGYFRNLTECELAEMIK